MSADVLRPRWRDWVKLGLSATIESTGLGGFSRAVRTFASGARIHVLGYHRVVDAIHGDGPVNPSLCITADSFRRQMEQVKERFVVLPLSYVVRALDGELEVPHDAVAITFDDGYRDVLMRAAPILSALDLPAAVFVPTGFATASGAARLLPHDRLYAGLWTARNGGIPLGDIVGGHAVGRTIELLASEGPAAAVEELIRVADAHTIERVIAAMESRLGAPALDDGSQVLQPHEVRELAELGWEIGAHTERHVVLTHEPIEEARRQLVESKADLERWSGRPCRYFAYCNGYHSRELVDELRRAGYEGAVTTCDKPNRVDDGDRFHITRKVLWEAHARGPHGQFSPTLSSAHLHDLFGALGLTRPVDGTVPQHVDPAATRGSRVRRFTDGVTRAGARLRRGRAVDSIGPIDALALPLDGRAFGTLAVDNAPSVALGAVDSAAIAVPTPTLVVDNTPDDATEEEPTHNDRSSTEVELAY